MNILQITQDLRDYGDDSFCVLSYDTGVGEYQHTASTLGI
jgi:hypothetical protein